MKGTRQKKILELIDKNDIDTQEMLVEKLHESGFEVTQTTASRDIRELKLVKVMTGRGTYKYTAPGAVKEKSAPVINSAITDSVISVDYANNLIVVKTLPGMGNAVGVCIDSLETSKVLGSVAGDDTVLVVVREEKLAETVASELREVFGA